ncbi:MAG: polysaccharide deacetylase family protein [Treponema sp.]|nr:polysaccharide deacetylase family protein [Treponema sp.]
MKYIALSFDDGPCPDTDYGGTKALLAVLNEFNVKASFFLIGRNVNNNKELAKAIFNEGHELGNHSYDHNRLGDLSEIEIAKNIERASDEISEATGFKPGLFRAPYLNISDDLIRVCAGKDLPIIDGSTHNDWPGEQELILKSVLNDPQDGEIIVLHENNTSQGNTMKALPQIINALHEMDFKIVTVSRLAELKGITLQAGLRYRCITR